mgnify:CR=1 FL=1
MQDRTLKYRGDVIARTESINALRAGQFQAMLDAVDRGRITTNDAQGTWDATGDARTREDHLMMEGQRRTLSQPFVSGSGAQLRYPGDTLLGATGKDTIQCRCRVEWKINFIGRSRTIQGFR